MVLDPYRVLGVPRNASEEEIKKAYRKKSRMYHPDANVNNPNAKQAEDKFKEVQEAYNQIMNQRDGKSQYAGGFSNNTGQYSYTSEDTIKMQAAANYINAKQFMQAINVLNQVNDRTAQWYYFSAIANWGIGNNVNAMNYARQAYNMEPNNSEYANLLDRLQYGNQTYRNMGDMYSRPHSGGSDLCCQLLCANMLCNMCCCNNGL